MRKRSKGKSSYKKTGFRKCRVSDFEEVNFKIDEDSRGLYEARFCPDIPEDVRDDYRIMNGYNNATERSSFAVEIIKCNPEMQDGC